MDGNKLDRELLSLADTISISNPITFGQKTTWRTSLKNAELVAKQEYHIAESLPPKFVLTESQNAKKANATNPKIINDDGSIIARNVDDDSIEVAIEVLPKRVSLAKRSHMDGILRGVPGGSMQISTTQQRAFVYDSEMNTMNCGKDTSHHRKRDAYSDYVEARARFSKMHSVK